MSTCSSGVDASRDVIEQVDAVTVALDIPRPLRLGRMHITRRLYTVVSVRTKDGLEGHALALSRDLPVTAVVRNNLSPALVGMPVDAITAVWRRGFEATYAGGRSSVAARAIGLVDIALWDIKGKRAGLPVWRLLGGDDPATRCVMVAGYPTGDPPEVLGERVAAYAEAGHRLIKVARWSDPTAMRKVLETAVAGTTADARLVVDAAWCWTRAEEAAEELALWADAAPLAWVEDPLAPEDTSGYARLVARRAAPIGVGDELGDVHAARRLALEARVDVLRIDAPAVGGITAAWRLAHVAEAAGALVSFHIYPETHVHLAAALGNGALSETFDGRDNPFDPAASLYHGGPAFSPDTAVAPEAPGLGIELDRELVAGRRID